MHAAWTVKHKPQTLSEVVGNREAIEKLVSWIKSWDKETPKKRAVFLFGPPGVGKTVSVEALAKDLNMEFVEKNASDYRTEEAIHKFAGLASQYGTLFGRKRLILLDELDGITGAEDKGGVKAITEIVKSTQCPLVLIANNAYDPRFATLRNYCLLIEFKKPPASEVMRHLKKICLKEKIEAEESALKFLAQRSGGDVRSAVNDLQALSQGKTRLTFEDVSWLAYRDRKEVIFDVLRLVFYGKSCEGAKQAVEMADVDPDMLLEWIYENAPYHFNDPQDLVKAMDALATADLYRGRIKRTQDWKLTRYVIDFMTAGVAMAREKSTKTGWIPFQFPKRIQLLSKSRLERDMKLRIGMKIRRRCHISAARSTSEVIPYLKVIFENNAEMAAKLAKWFDFDEEMIEYLAGGKKKQTKAITSLLT